jgi:hypothetical protein
MVTSQTGFVARRRPPRSTDTHRRLGVDGSHWRADGRPKVRYPSQAAALSAADERRDEAGGELNTYRCDFCGGWHMGRRDREP